MSDPDLNLENKALRRELEEARELLKFIADGDFMDGGLCQQFLDCPSSLNGHILGPPPDGIPRPYNPHRQSWDDVLDRDKFIVRCLDCKERIFKDEKGVYTFFGFLRHTEHDQNNRPLRKKEIPYA